MNLCLQLRTGDLAEQRTLIEEQVERSTEQRQKCAVCIISFFHCIVVSLSKLKHWANPCKKVHWINPVANISFPPITPETAGFKPMAIVVSLCKSILTNIYLLIVSHLCHSWPRIFWMIFYKSLSQGGRGKQNNFGDRVSEPLARSCSSGKVFFILFCINCAVMFGI